MTPRIAVTTTIDRYSRWADPLADRGFQPVRLPCIEVRPRDGEEVESSLAGADWLVVTSPRVIEILWPDGGMPSVPVAAVGKRTASVAGAAGARVVLTGDDDGDRLADLLSERTAGGRVVIPHGSRADLTRWERLRGSGTEVHTVEVYETVPVPPGPDPVEGAVFGSPSAVEGWSRARSLAGLRPLGAIGRVTAAVLRRHGGGDPIVPARPDPRLLAMAMSATLEKTP